VAIDWERYDEAEDDSAESDSEELYEGNEEVRRLDQASLDEARQKYDFIVLDVAFPRCTKCRSVLRQRSAPSLLPSIKSSPRFLGCTDVDTPLGTSRSFHRQPFASAAKNANNDKALFGFVDAQEQRELRHKFDAKCDYECSVRLADVPTGTGGHVDCTHHQPAFLHISAIQLHVIDAKKEETTELRSSGTPEEIENLIKRHLKRTFLTRPFSSLLHGMCIVKIAP
jgi:hypothetical protein